jgi:hypothetical protein
MVMDGKVHSKMERFRRASMTMTFNAVESATVVQVAVRSL